MNLNLVKYAFQIVEHKTVLGRDEYQDALEQGVNWYENSKIRSWLSKEQFWFIPLILGLLFPFLKKGFDKFMESIEPVEEAPTMVEVLMLALETARAEELDRVRMAKKWTVEDTNEDEK